MGFKAGLREFPDFGMQAGTARFEPPAHQEYIITHQSITQKNIIDD
jgi:hypothetical protein